MASAFQLGAFQIGAFQIDADPTDLPIGATILQRRKVDLVGVTKKRWKEHRAEQRERKRLEAIAARAAKEKAAKEVIDVAQYEQQWEDYRNQGLEQFNRLLFDLERQEQDRLAKLVNQFAVDAMGRQAAIDAFNKQAMMQERMARLRQFTRDSEEEEEALELLMMDD
jgi:thymidylate synthase